MDICLRAAAQSFKYMYRMYHITKYIYYHFVFFKTQAQNQCKYLPAYSLNKSFVILYVCDENIEGEYLL